VHTADEDVESNENENTFKTKNKTDKLGTILTSRRLGNRDVCVQYTFYSRRALFIPFSGERDADKNQIIGAANEKSRPPEIHRRFENIT